MITDDIDFWAEFVLICFAAFIVQFLVRRSIAWAWSKRKTTKPKPATKPKTHFVLSWFEKEALDGNPFLVGSVEMKNTTEDDVRVAFELEKDEYPGDCLPVKKRHVLFAEMRSGVTVDLKRFDYFVEYEQV